MFPYSDVDQPVESFPIATEQLIEIAKALSGQATVIIMDEPTSALRAPNVGESNHSHYYPSAA